MKKVFKVLLFTLAAALVISAFCALGAFADETGIISMDSDTITPVAALKVSFDIPEDHVIDENDWVGIYSADADIENIGPGSGIGIWCYLGTNTSDMGEYTDRHVEITFDYTTSYAGNWPLAPGEYQVLLFYEGEYAVDAHHSFTVVDKIISMDTSMVTSGDPMTVKINLPEDHALAGDDWIGIYKKEIDNNNVQSGSGMGIWCYLGSNTQSYGTPENRQFELKFDEELSAAGSWPLAPGDYKFLLFYNDSYKVADYFEFTVKDKAAEDKKVVYMDKNEFYPGETLEVKIDLPEGHSLESKDWIGIYSAEVENNNVYAGAGIGMWCYIGSNTQSFEPMESSHLLVEVDEHVATVPENWPLEPGEWKVFLFYNDSYTVADYFEFTVVEKPATPTPEPTATPEATEAPTDDPADAPTAAPTEKPAEKKGCGSAVVSSALVAASVLLGTALIVRKKDNE
ncbi:MAG: hypothetical protein II748_02505 [Clostridia bacterium]|nr:hypothetical protein [Clostridia bacterium]